MYNDYAQLYIQRNLMKIILDSSMVEHSAVNRGVVGSSPTRGVFSLVKKFIRELWLHGQAVKTPPFHGGNRGSNPLGVIFFVTLTIVFNAPMWLNWQSS